MKIALCLHGVVGHLYTDKQKHRWIQDVDYRIGLEHYTRYLFDANGPVDVFMHSWSTKYEKEIVRDYQPKKHRFEQQIDFKLQTTALNFLKSRWYSTKASVALKREYELENQMTYDWVVLSRFDVALLTPLRLRDHDSRTFQVLKHAPDDVVSPNAPCDLFYFGASETMDRFSRLYDVWEEYGVFNAHAESELQLQSLQCPVAFPITADKDCKLVRSIYHDCQYAGEQYRGTEHLTKLTTDIEGRV